MTLVKRNVTIPILILIGLALLGPIALHMRLNIVQLHPLVAPKPRREIRLDGKSILNEGLGAVVQGLKPVLLLANATGAVITAHDKVSGHGYHLTKYLRLERFIDDGLRVKCAASRNISKLLGRIVDKCERFPFHTLAHVFDGCNMLVIDKYLVHPRPCVRHTAPLIRAVTRFPKLHTRRKNVCILRRGGDVENRIMNGTYNIWGLDVTRMKPVLSELRRRGAHVVVVTETAHEKHVRRQFKPHVLSNREPLEDVVRRLHSCQCLFVSSGSSFAITMVQVTTPPHVIYTANHSAYRFFVQPYPYKEFGASATSILEHPLKLAKLCTSRRRN